jgi:glycosyltransferase involved in cell wall biosynthesis
MIDWALGFGGIEIILVEQDSEEKIKPYSIIGVRHIFTKSNLPFNRSWAFNVGMKWASTNAIVFSDADIVMDPNQFIESLKKLEQYECVNPAKNIIYLNAHESNMGLDQWKNIFRNNELNDNSICRGMVMFRRDAIEKLGGWTEDFIGWGGEDDHQTFKVLQLLSYFECDFRCYHLHHNVESKNDFYYQRNIQLLEKLKSMTIDDTTKFINNSRSKIGLKMRFADK